MIFVPAIPCARLRVLAALLVLAATSGPGRAQQGLPPAGQLRPAQIDRNGVLILIRSTLLAVHQANLTGNYTVLRDLGAPGFQAANTAAHLGEIFAGLRNQHLDLSGVAVLEPQLTVLPELNSNGLMHMAGFFPSIPLQVNFDLIFAPASGRWQALGIAINVGQSAPSAPATPAETNPRSAAPSGPGAGVAPQPAPSNSARSPKK